MFGACTVRLTYTTPTKLQYYDDGVGSQEFLPLKLLGGVFGYGLKNNVIELYTYLCRHYDPDDKIYLFGFSRGAFTVRVLAGLIAHCGLVTNCYGDRELKVKAKEHYRTYRSRYNHGYLTKLFLVLTKAIHSKFSSKSTSTVSTLHPDIEFIGVWDTVDAYGLPIDELAILWDLLIYPLRFPDQQLSTKIPTSLSCIINR